MRAERNYSGLRAGEEESKCMRLRRGAVVFSKSLGVVTLSVLTQYPVVALSAVKLLGLQLSDLEDLDALQMALSTLSLKDIALASSLSPIVFLISVESRYQNLGGLARVLKIKWRNRQLPQAQVDEAATEQPRRKSMMMPAFSLAVSASFPLAQIAKQAIRFVPGANMVMYYLTLLTEIMLLACGYENLLNGLSDPNKKLREYLIAELRVRPTKGGCNTLYSSLDEGIATFVENYLLEMRLTRDNSPVKSSMGRRVAYDFIAWPLGHFLALYSCICSIPVLKLEATASIRSFIYGSDQLSVLGDANNYETSFSYSMACFFLVCLYWSIQDLPTRLVSLYDTDLYPARGFENLKYLSPLLCAGIATLFALGFSCVSDAVVDAGLQNLLIDSVLGEANARIGLPLAIGLYSMDGLLGRCQNFFTERRVHNGRATRREAALYHLGTPISLEPSQYPDPPVCFGLSLFNKGSAVSGRSSLLGSSLPATF